MSSLKSIDEVGAAISQVQETAFVKEKKQAINNAVRNHFRDADHFYIDKYLETLQFLEPEIESLQKVASNKNYAEDENIKKRLELLTGSGNNMVFSEGVVQSNPLFQETTETLVHPVEVNLSDLKNILSKVEGVDIGTFKPGPNRPQLIIIDFKLEKKSVTEKNEVYVLNMKLLKKRIFVIMDPLSLINKIIFKYCLPAAILAICFSCSNSKLQDNSDKLTSISIVSREGTSETHSNEDRLKQYENVDFLQNQPYQKVMRIYGRDIQGNVTAYITSYLPNGQVKQYLEVLNGRAYGNYLEWYPNGVQKVEVFVIGGEPDLNTAAEKTWLFDGCSKAWDENGRPMAEIQYSKGELDGPSIYYHPNGTIWKRVPFSHNKIDGTYEIFRESGDLFQTTEYSNGQKNGVSIRYWGRDKIASEESYCNGLLMSAHYYDIKGNQISQIVDGNGNGAVLGKEGVTTS